jgi:hypothetical protein
MSLYLDGAPADSASMGGFNIEQLGFNTGRFGCGYYFADPDLAGSINELRIYAGVLTTNDVLNNFNAGPDTLQPLSSTPQIRLAVARSGNQLVLTWPLGTLEQAGNLTGPWSTVSGATSPYMPVMASSKMFYRVRLN